MSSINEKFNTGEIEINPDQAIIDHNLQMLNKDMVNFLSTESIGGNAGSIEINGKKYNCGAANGYADPETGKIIVFDNIQNIRDRKIVEDNIDFTLLVAMDWQIGEFVKIVNFFIGRYNKRTLSDRGRLAIEAAINKWNIEHNHLIPPRQK